MKSYTIVFLQQHCNPSIKPIAFRFARLTHKNKAIIMLVYSVCWFTVYCIYNINIVIAQTISLDQMFSFLSCAFAQVVYNFKMAYDSVEKAR